MKAFLPFWILGLCIATFSVAYSAPDAGNSPFVECATLARNADILQNPINSATDVDKWAKVVCLDSLQILTQQDGWYWKFPTLPVPVSIPADGLADGAPITDPVYFKRIKTTQLQETELASLRETYPSWARFMQDGTLVLELSLENNNGLVQTLYFYDPNDDFFWATICCDDKMPPFTVINAEKRLSVKVTFEDMLNSLTKPGQTP